MTVFAPTRPLPAAEPPEARGLARHDVRLLVARSADIAHATFRELPAFLTPGDLVVINTSATVPAAIDAVRTDGRAVVVHVATHLDDDGGWVVELRRPDGSGPFIDGEPGEVVRLLGGLRLRLLAPHSTTLDALPRLWRVELLDEVDPLGFLYEHGRPITYGYVRGRWPLAHYQPVFGRHPGSAEMPSAGRPFTPEVVIDLLTAGIAIAPVTLHSGVSSPELGEPPQPERFVVSEATAALVDHTRWQGRRVIAVGTTVTRALESAVGPDGSIEAAEGWTDLVLGEDRPARVVDGLITGWHEDGSSHLALLRAVAGNGLVAAAYAAGDGYRWHEFGDSCLFLPSRDG